MQSAKSSLTNTYLGVSGETYVFTYYETDNFDVLPYEKVTQCYAVCYIDDKVLIVKNGKKNTWGLIGGSVEHSLSENYEETLKRELVEEGNVKMNYCKPHRIRLGELPFKTSPNQLFYSCAYDTIVLYKNI